MGTHLAALISILGFVVLFFCANALGSVEGPRDTGLVGGPALIGLAILIWPICSGHPYRELLAGVIAGLGAVLFVGGAAYPADPQPEDDY